MKPSKKAGEEVKFAWLHGSPLVQERNSVNQPCRQPPLLLNFKTYLHIFKTMSTETTSPTDNVEIYRQLEEYPWDTDKEFQVR